MNGKGGAPASSGGMGPELRFEVEDVGVLEHAATPTLNLDLSIDAGGTKVRSISLNADVRIRARERDYDAEERTRLYELFGAPSEWGRSLRSIPWIRTSAVVPAFDGRTRIDLPVPCTYDFDVAATKYLHALDGGTVPLELLFSGTLFRSGPNGALQATRLSLETEARFEMETRIWQEMMDHYFPNSAWIRLRRDLFERLLAFRSEEGLGTWERTLEVLLDSERTGERRVHGGT